MFTVTMKQVISLQKMFNTVSTECCVLGVRDAHANYRGRVIPVGHFQMYCLQSSLSNKVSCKGLKQSLFHFAIELKTISPDLYSQKLYDFLSKMYPDHKISIFIFGQGKLDHTACKNTKGWCHLRKVQHPKLQYDILIILT